MPNYQYYQQSDQNEDWRPFPVADLERLEREDKPFLITVLAVSRVIDEDLTYEDKLKLAYSGPLYFDWDLKTKKDESKAEAEDAWPERVELVTQKVNQFLDSLAEMRVDLACCRLYATGGRGFHLEVPQKVFMDKVPPKGVVGLPYIYRVIAESLAVDTLDLNIYSGSRGRMWRTCNVKRPNGRYKVPITVAEMRGMTPDLYKRLTAEPRPLDMVTIKAPKYCAELAIAFDKAKQVTDELMEKRRKFKPDPKAAKYARADSIQYAMAGLGIRPDAGFNEIAIQLAIAAVTAGTPVDQFVAECEGLINSHESDGNRYNSPGKRRDELRRMHRVMDGNEMYEFSVGGIKRILTHSAPDLDGIRVDKDDLKKDIEESLEDLGDEQDEYSDVARSISMQKYGTYKMHDGIMKRICSISYVDSSILLSMTEDKIVGYESVVTVNAVPRGKTMIELEVFSGLQKYSAFAQKYGHAFQGSDADVRTLMMRFVEGARKKGKSMYVAKREGLDLLSVSGSPVPEFSTPFLVWADAHNVMIQPSARDAGMAISFQGYPDPRGVVKTDISTAPQLDVWLEEDGNRELMRKTLLNLMGCQKSDLMGKVIGWYVACFWKQLFQHVQKKFPLLHVAGAAGVGKSETNQLLGGLFLYQNEVRMLSPSSTLFSIKQFLSASASIPVIIDEYKPQEMKPELQHAYKLLFRDAYNQRPLTRGGGSRESDDYRSLYEVELAAPVAFIAEATEEEAAVMERVVLATFSKPPQVQLLKNLAKFQFAKMNRNLLGILGQYLAVGIIETETVKSFSEVFDPILQAAQQRYMLTEADMENLDTMDATELANKRQAKERSVFNYAVAEFGFIKFRDMVREIFGNDEELDELMEALHAGIYTRLSDLNAATTPEHIKVLSDMAQMSYQKDADSSSTILQNSDYAFVQHGTKDCIEIAIIPAYSKYRFYCNMSRVEPLFKGKDSFMSALRESPAFVKMGTGQLIQMPNVYTFDIDELSRFGVDIFKKK